MNLHRWTDASTCLPSLNPQRSNLNPHIVIVLEYSNPPTSCEHRPSAYTPGRRQWSSLTAAQRCHRRKIQSWRRRDAVGASLRGPVATLPCQVQVAQAVGRQREGTYPTIALQVCLDVEKAKSGNVATAPPESGRPGESARWAALTSFPRPHRCGPIMTWMTPNQIR